MILIWLTGIKRAQHRVEHALGLEWDQNQRPKGKVKY